MIAFIPYIAPPIVTSHGSYHGSYIVLGGAFPALCLIVGTTCFTVAAIRESNRQVNELFGYGKGKRTGFDAALLAVSLISPISWVLLLGYGLYQLARQFDDSP